jgi:putative pyruvate formate lyase activating enzyme
MVLLLNQIFLLEWVMPVLSTRTENSSIRPRFLQAYRSGLLDSKISEGKESFKKCCLCPRLCKVNRFEEEGKICETGINTQVSSYFPHFGEERCLSGVRGSGTIFFSSCNLRCVFCQNWEISHACTGREVTPIEIAQMMIDLQDRGCHNINFVTPSHVVVQILMAVKLAAEMGLSIPLVYNTSAYDSVESLRLLDGVIDIYMPDFKFWNRDSANRYMNAPNYPQVSRRNIQIMHDQVGDLKVNDQQLALRGLLVRHLVIPGHLKDTARIVRFLAECVSPATTLNIMFQYRPEYRVDNRHFQELNRPLSLQEREFVKRIKRESGLPEYPWV